MSDESDYPGVEVSMTDADLRNLESLAKTISESIWEASPLAQQWFRYAAGLIEAAVAEIHRLRSALEAERRRGQDLVRVVCDSGRGQR